MKLFILAPEITENHTALAFLPTWIRKISEKVDKVMIFTLNHDKNTLFPRNVKVYSPPRNNKYIYFFFINYYILKNVFKSDVVFSMMYPILTIWAGPYSKLFQKPIVMWYAHGSVSENLKKAYSIAKFIVTSSD